MSFIKSKIKRFNEIPSCAPPPGTYDPRSPGPKRIKGHKINTAERFKKPSGLQPKSITVNTTFKIPSNFSSQSSIYTECSKKSKKSLTSKNMIKNEIENQNQPEKPNFGLIKYDIEQVDCKTESSNNKCNNYFQLCYKIHEQTTQNQVCKVVIENSQAALHAVCQRLRDTCDENEILRNESAKLREEIGDIKCFEKIAAEQIAIVEENLIDKVNNYMNIAKNVKNNWLNKIKFILTALDQLENMVGDEVKQLIQKLKIDIESEKYDNKELGYTDLLKKYDILTEKNSQLEEELEKKDDLERKIIELTNEKNDLVAKLQNNKSRLNIPCKNRLDALATPRRRADIENIAPKNKTYVLKSNTLKTTKPVAQSSPLREKNW
ncbi:hyaluronan mediated motility receptor-like [Daktulosphaira vitifoliae]|uniref:hyaluronan mediated motility receptor-like n=1 Tax=Daktulosphaira vitifoliae TaxID=58002 RepID=UPI0021AAAF50|nr:hyaluronan mediated motility receptor-like [Daktulosphaira vitifoliae]